MKKIIGILVLLLSGSVLAVSYTDTANIINTKEVYKTVQVKKPYQYCREVAVRQNYRGDGSATNELIGGILGGVIGNQFGKGSGKDIATIAGALLGASIANDDEIAKFKRQNTQGVRTQEVCEMRYQYEPEERFNHYLVTYRYKGVEHSYRSNYKPKSKKINVRVSVHVAPDNGNYQRR